MAFKRMQHPEHGFHDAATTKEADEMRKSGWVDCVAPVKPAPVEAEAEAEVEQEVRRKPGRPPKG